MNKPNKQEEFSLDDKTQYFVSFNQAYTNAEALLKYHGADNRKLEQIVGGYKNYLEKKKSEENTDFSEIMKQYNGKKEDLINFYCKTFKDHQADIQDRELFLLLENVMYLLYMIYNGRNFYSHHYHEKNFFNISEDFNEFLNKLFDRAKGNVENNLNENDQQEDTYKEFCNYTYSILVKKNDNHYEITNQGMVFIACIFLNRNDAGRLINATYGLKGTNKEAFKLVRKTYLHFSKDDKYLYSKPESGNADTQFLRFAEIYNYLNHAPAITVKHSELKKWIGDEENNSRIRRQNKFCYFATRYLLDSGLLPGFKFEAFTGNMLQKETTHKVGKNKDIEIKQTQIQKEVTWIDQNGEEENLMPHVEANNALLQTTITDSSEKERKVKVLLGEKELKNLLYVYFSENKKLSSEIRDYIIGYYKAMEKLRENGNFNDIDLTEIELPAYLKKLKQNKMTDISLKDKCFNELKLRKVSIDVQREKERKSLSGLKRAEKKRFVWKCLKYYIPVNRRERISRESLNQLSISLYEHGKENSKAKRLLTVLKDEGLLPPHKKDLWIKKLNESINKADNLYELKSILLKKQTRKFVKIPSDQNTNEKKVAYLIRRLLPRKHTHEFDNYREQIDIAIRKFDSNKQVLIDTLKKYELLEPANPPQWTTNLVNLILNNKSLEDIYNFFIAKNDYKKTIESLKKEFESLTTDDEIARFAKNILFIASEKQYDNVKEYLDKYFFKVNKQDDESYMPVIFLPQGFMKEKALRSQVFGEFKYVEKRDGEKLKPENEYNAFDYDYSYEKLYSVSQFIRQKFAVNKKQLERGEEFYYQLLFNNNDTPVIRKKAIRKLNECLTHDLLLVEIAKNYYKQYLKHKQTKKGLQLSDVNLTVEQFSKSKLQFYYKDVPVETLSHRLNDIKDLQYNLKLIDLMDYIMLKCEANSEPLIKLEYIRKQETKEKGEFNLFDEMENKRKKSFEMAKAVLQLEKIMYNDEKVKQWDNTEYIDFGQYYDALSEEAFIDKNEEVFKSLKVLRNKAAHNQPPFISKNKIVWKGKLFEEFEKGVEFINKAIEQLENQSNTIL